MTFDINTAKTAEIRTETRDRFGSKEIAVWMNGRNRISDGEPLTRQSDMQTDDWKACYSDLSETLTGESVTVTQAPAAPKPQAAPAPKPQAAPAMSLDDIKPFVSDTVFGVLKASNDAANKRAETAERERDQAKAQAAQAQAAPAPVVVNMAPAKSGAHQTQSTGQVNAGNLFPGSRTLTARNIMIDVCDCPDAPRLDPNFLWDKQTPDMLAALSLGMNVLIFGAKGTGKSSWARNLAALTKRPYHQIGFHAETSSAELFGFQGPDASGGMAWVPGDLLEAMQTPFAIVDLSEISFARPELTAQLFSVLETSDRTVFVGGKRYHVHPTVWFIGTSNDNGSGEMSHRYHGTRPMNPALVSRFGVRVEFQTAERSRLAKMLAKQAGVSLAAGDVLAGFEKAMEKGVKSGNCEDTPGVRSLLAWAGMVKAGTPSKTAFDLTVLNSAPSDDAAYWAQEAAAQDPHAALEQAISGNAPAPASDDNAAPDMDAPTRAGFSEL